MPKRLNDVVATIRNVAQDSAQVYLTKHAQEQMHDREISLTQVLKCLRSGELFEGPIQDSTRELGWKSTTRTLSAGVWIEVVSKLIERDDDFILVITAYRRGR